MAFSRRKLPTIGMANTVPDWARAQQYATASASGTTDGYAIIYKCVADGYLFMTTRGTDDNDITLIAGTSEVALLDKSAGDPYASSRFILLGNSNEGSGNQHASMAPVRGSVHSWYVRVKSGDNITLTRLYFVPFVSTPTQTYLELVYSPTTSHPMGSGMSGNPAEIPT